MHDLDKAIVVVFLPGEFCGLLAALPASRVDLSSFLASQSRFCRCETASWHIMGPRTCLVLFRMVRLLKNEKRNRI